MRDIREVFKLYNKSNSDVLEEYNKIKEANGQKTITLQSFKNLIQYGNPTVATLEMLASAIGCPVSVFFEQKTDDVKFKCPKCGTPLNIEITQL